MLRKGGGRRVISRKVKALWSVVFDINKISYWMICAHSTDAHLALAALCFTVYSCLKKAPYSGVTVSGAGLLLVIKQKQTAAFLCVELYSETVELFTDDRIAVFFPAVRTHRWFRAVWDYSSTDAGFFKLIPTDLLLKICSNISAKNTLWQIACCQLNHSIFFFFFCLCHCTQSKTGTAEWLSVNFTNPIL